MAPRKPAFDEAVRCAYPRLAAAARLLAANASDADDAVQETVALALRSYDSFRGDASPTTWMYRILVNVLRARSRRPDALPLDAASGQPAATPPPEVEAAASEEVSAAWRCIRSMPDRQREIVTLHYIESLSYQEIADALGVSIGTVKQSLFRARTQLRAALGEKPRKECRT